MNKKKHINFMDSFIEWIKNKYTGVYLWQLDQALQSYFINKFLILSGCLLCTVVLIIILHDIYISIFALAVSIATNLPPLSSYIQICKGKIMVIEGECTDVFDVSQLRGIKGKLRKSYSRNYFIVKKDGLFFQIYTVDLKRISVGDIVRFYTNPDAAMLKDGNTYVINDCFLFIKI